MLCLFSAKVCHEGSRFRALSVQIGFQLGSVFECLWLDVCEACLQDFACSQSATVGLLGDDVIVSSTDESHQRSCFPI